MKKRTIVESRDLLEKLVNDKFIFDKMEYKKAKSKINFTCKKCGHTFQRTLGNYQRTDKCPYCEGKINKWDTESFIEELKKVWGGMLDYSKVKYTDIDSKITLVCKKHNHEYEQTAYEAKKGQHGCKECNSEYMRDIQIKSLEYYQDKLEILYPNKYKILNRDQSKRIYMVKCLEHNEVFSCHIQHMYKDHISCNTCKQSKRGKSENTFIPFYDKPTWLYYVKLTYKDRYYYKIGITTKEDIIKGRFEGKRYSKFKPTLLLSVHYAKGEDAFKEESRYLNMFKEFKISPYEKFLPSGNTEVFNTDVFNVDINKK